MRVRGREADWLGEDDGLLEVLTVTVPMRGLRYTHSAGEGSALAVAFASP